MFSPSLVCGINVCFVQLQDMHDMQENVRQSNLQLVLIIFCRLFHLGRVLFGKNRFR